MQFQITHNTQLKFSEETDLLPQVLRFTPFRMSHYDIASLEMQVLPQPKGITTKKDIVNNTVAFAWFENRARQLDVEAEIRVQTHAFDPLDFVVYPEQFLSMNFHYSRKRWPLLIPYLETNSESRDLKNYTRKMLDEADGKTLPFIYGVIKSISKEFMVHQGISEGNPSSLKTLQNKQGTPAEIAWMAQHMMRANGIASRVVSGYYLAGKAGLSERHAWIQVYVPGPGWLGLDPTSGRVTDHNYIPVVATPYFENLASVSGEVVAGVEIQRNEEIKIKRL